MGKHLPVKKISRQDRERDVLLGLVDLYVRSGKPIGSHTLQEEGFEHLSSATIRNYFAKLELEGFLKQQHTSGGRTPTDRAYRLYAEEAKQCSDLPKEDVAFLSSFLLQETKAIPIYLQGVTQAISDLSGCSTFLTAPRFDQDFIVKMQLMQIDESRILCAVLTDFGQVHAEIVPVAFPLSQALLKKLEGYFHYRLTGLDKPSISESDEALAKQIYNEIVLRHFVSYTNMHSDEVYKAGFSKLLNYPEFHDPAILSHTLSLFENTPLIRSLLDEAFQKDSLMFWIGDDLKHALPSPHLASLIAIPYRIGQKSVGVLSLLGPDRLPYGRLFAILQKASHYLSENLTKSLYKFKLTYRQPKSKELDMQKASSEILGLTHENSNG